MLATRKQPLERLRDKLEVRKASFSGTENSNISQTRPPYDMTPARARCAIRISLVPTFQAAVALSSFDRMVHHEYHPDEVTSILIPLHHLQPTAAVFTSVKMACLYEMAAILPQKPHFQTSTRTRQRLMLWEEIRPGSSGAQISLW